MLHTTIYNNLFFILWQTLSCAPELCYTESQYTFAKISMNSLHSNLPHYIIFDVSAG